MTQDVIAFTKVRLPYGWLGNMSPFPVVHDGERYRTAEALFQALRFEDPTIRKLIRSINSPMLAKLRAKSIREYMTVTPLSDVDLDNMRMVVRLKLQQHPELQTELLATGEKRIIEDCTNRRRGSWDFWGAALVDGVWLGRNWLGRIWMAQRASLQAGIKIVPPK